MVCYCAVYGCLESNRCNKDRRFFRFPSDAPRCKLWIKAIGRMDLASKSVNTLHTNYVVCELHFADNVRLKKKLKGNAVPTLLLPQLDNSSGTVSKSTQTELEMTFNTCRSTQTTTVSESTPQKRKLSCTEPEELEELEARKCKLLELLCENLANAKESDMPLILKKLGADIEFVSTWDAYQQLSFLLNKKRPRPSSTGETLTKDEQSKSSEIGEEQNEVSHNIQTQELHENLRNEQSRQTNPEVSDNCKESILKQTVVSAAVKTEMQDESMIDPATEILATRSPASRETGSIHSPAPAPAADESQLYADFLASKMRLYTPPTKLELQHRISILLYQADNDHFDKPQPD